uniref:Uncharacterized protein n=1 Tax=Glossina pallidipes TaxID=7398 RepID=A0A1A9Z4X5_GLOPL
MPLYFAFGTDFLLDIRYAKVINNQGCGKNGFTVSLVTSVLTPRILLALIILDRRKISLRTCQKYDYPGSPQFGPFKT